MSAKQGVPLMLWRRNKEANVKRLVPAALPPEMAAIVSKRFQDAKISVQLEELKKKQGLEQEKKRITEKARVEQTRVTREIQELPAQSRQNITRTEQELAQLRKALAEKEWGLVVAKRNLAAYAHINFFNYLKAIFGR